MNRPCHIPPVGKSMDHAINRISTRVPPLHSVPLAPMDTVPMSTDSGTAGRVVRTALIIFPFGLILLGAGSFIFYFNHKEQTTQRAIKYAAGLRKDLNEADLTRYEQIFDDALAKPAPERLRTLSSFLESTLGPENMGYTIRVAMDKLNHEAIPLAYDVEVTGASKPRDLVLVLTGYLPETTTLDNHALARPNAVFLSIAHSLSSQAKTRSIRFIASQNMAAVKAYYDQLITNQERISHIVLLGAMAEATDAVLTESMHLQGRGVVFLRPQIAAGSGSLLPSAQALLKQVTDLAEKL